MKLEQLLDRNKLHAEQIDDDRFDGLQDRQAPEAVSVCCSDSRVPQEGMWSVREAGWMFTVGNIGNQVWDTADGDRVVDGSLLYPLKHTGTRNVLVVGHTGCGAVTAAHDWVVNDEAPQSPGIHRLVEQLVPVVRKGLDSGVVDSDTDKTGVVNQLVEYSVRTQVGFLSESTEIPSDTDIYGFVYDFQGAYGGLKGTTYLVSMNGETDVEPPTGYKEYARSLLE